METQETPGNDNKVEKTSETSNDSKVVSENNSTGITESTEEDAAEEKTNAAEEKSSFTVMTPAKKKKKKKKKKLISESDDDEVYELSTPIKYRVERAVQKYKASRMFDNISSQILSSYLHFGGVAEDTTLCAYENDPMIPNGMEVDITYNVKVYLSSYIINETGYVNEDAFREAPIVIESFLNYLVRRQVCPEYSEDLQEALKITQLAKDELLNCKLMTQDAPGKFNKACSLLFGGELYGRFDNPYPSEESLASLFGIYPEEAEQIVKKVFGDNALNELTEVKQASRLGLVVKIVKINELPESATTNDTENDISDDDDWLRLYYIRKFDVCEFDVPNAKSFTIAVGPDLAFYLMDGMLISADFHQLSNGFWYWDNTIYIYPSYYTKPDESDSDE